MKGIVFLSLLFSPSFIYAQSLDVGVRVNFLQNFDQSFLDDRINSLPSNNIDWKVRSYSADIWGEAVKDSNIFHRIRAGYQYALIATHSVSNSSNGESVITNSETSAAGYRFGIGMGKLYAMDKLTFKVGIELFVGLNTDWHNEYNSDYFDSNGDKTQTVKISFNEPGQKAGGFGLFTGIYYNFWNSFHVGLDISNYFQYAQKKGTITIVYEYFDGNGNLTSTETENDESKLNAFSTFFLSPAISVCYRF